MIVLAPCALPPWRSLAPDGSGNAWKVDAPVFFKVLVFDGRDRVVKNLGTLLVSHQDAALQREAPDELAIIGIDFRHYGRTVGFQRANFRQITRIHKKQSTSRANRNGTKQEKRQRNAINQFPTAQPQRNRGQAQHRKTILSQKDF